MEEKEKILEDASLGFFLTPGKDKVWLAIKTRKIGKGLYNGYGGGLEKGESMEKCLQREIKQECKINISLKKTEKIAIIDFHNRTEEGKKFVCKVHVYFIHDFKGTPKESKEMKKPKKFEVRRLPLKKMMPADKIWLPIILGGKKITAEFFYGPHQKKLTKKEKIKIVKSLPN